MERIEIWEEGEYTYPLAFGFTPNLRPYPQPEGKANPCMLIAPGGGYCMVSPTEGEVVADAFCQLGYSCFVLTYTTNLLMKSPLMEQPMRDLARAIRWLRAHAEMLRIDPDRLYVCGFSAAGHLCATVCDYFAEISDPKYASVSCRPDAAILSYPVITSGEFAHQDSFRALLGKDIYERNDEESQALLNRFSLEKHVRKDTPPCFLWQTVTDELVPVENSYLYAGALRRAGVPHAHHIFPRGHHGLSVANQAWAEGRFGEPYPMEQIVAMARAAREGVLPLPEEIKAPLTAMAEGNQPAWNEKVYPDVSVWPALADRFLQTLEG